MVRPIVKDPIFLAQKSVDATAEDLPLARDLLETLQAHEEECVGMAGNMIGEAKRVIAFACDGTYQVMFNPEILRAKEPYEAEEGCLSLSGVRKCRRYRSIKVRYQNESMETRIKTYHDFTAQIIQDEIDHCNGIII